MLRRLLERFEFTKGLGFRLGSLLSVAILPIGLISVIQTLHLSREYERSAEIALLGLTSVAAAGERALLQGALGSADRLGPVVLATENDPAACSKLMTNFAEGTAVFNYAGFTDINGIVACSSIPGVRDATKTAEFMAFSENPRTLVSAREGGSLIARPVVTVSQPVYRGTRLLGYVTLAMSHDLLRSSHLAHYGMDNAGTLTFNNQGQVLTIDRDSITDLAQILPENQNLMALIARSETTFRARANNGEKRVFSVVPVVPGLVYALGSWNRDQSGVAGLELTRFSAILLPILLWLASLVVAYFAVYRLVLRHISVLRRQMRRFAIADRSKPPPVLTSAPAEIADMSQTFHNMARILIRDEDALEKAVNEKTVLLKEVHHRVKNNLQLIASIINMQIRAIDHVQATRVLRSVQDRVTSLAAIYRNLYQAEHLASVEADRLIKDIIGQMGKTSVEAGSGLRIETRLERLMLLPDQAVPLALLATEAFTNAIKYAGPSQDGQPPWVKVELKLDDQGRAHLLIANSFNSDPDEAEGTGLGGQLIEAFATQLDGTLTANDSGGVYTLTLDFTVENVPRFASEPADQKVVLTSATRSGARY